MEKVSKEDFLNRIKKSKDVYRHWDTDKFTRFVTMIGLFHPDIIDEFEQTEKSIQPTVMRMIEEIKKNPSKWGVKHKDDTNG